MMTALRWLRDHLSPERRGYERFDPSSDETITCFRAKGIDAAKAIRQVRRDRRRLHSMADDLFPSHDHPRKDA